MQRRSSAARGNTIHKNMTTPANSAVSVGSRSRAALRRNTNNGA